MLLYWLLVVILKFNFIFGDVKHRRVIRQQDGFGNQNACSAPNGESGECREIKSCYPLYSLLETRGREPAVADYLRRSQCGIRENNRPKVCCTQNAPYIQSSGATSAYQTTSTTSRYQYQTPSTTSRYQYQNPSTSTSRNQFQTPSSPTRQQVTPALPQNGAVDSQGCGKSTKKATRIIAGQPATLGDWPWMVALGYRTNNDPGPQFKCGASLISDRWVVTAAHCVRNIGSLTLTTARVGDLILTEGVSDGATPIDVPVDQVIPHPNYTTNPITNDIALIRLRNPVTFTNLIRPICLLGEAEHRSDGFYDRKLPFITGWGATEWRGPTSQTLMEAQIEIIDNTRCAQNYSSQRSAQIDERTLCAGGGGKDTCQGDSGGPLIIPIQNTYYLAGVVSYGIRCADVNFPGVYTRVAYFHDWITRTARS